MTTIAPVLLAGGSGTRLWPLSRQRYPKQFLKLKGERSSLQHAALNVSGIDGALPVTTLCGEHHRFIVADQLLEAGLTGTTVILEPEGRNTAPAAAVAARYIADSQGEQTLLLLMPSDQFIADAEAFRAAIQLASVQAAQGRIMSFGVRPARPDTAHSYIKPGQALTPGTWTIDSFMERPDTAQARAIIAGGDYCWNAGIYLFKAGAFLELLRKIDPEMVAAVDKAVCHSRRDPDFIRLNAEAFLGICPLSIDCAVMEKTDECGMVMLDAGWDDLSSWRSFDRLPQDGCGNSVQGDVMLASARNNLVLARSRLVVLLGVDDLVVVETQDAVLVTSRDQVDGIERVVAELLALKRIEALEHPQVHRPWGSYESIGTGMRFQVKKIIVKPRCKLSLQQHHHRAEHWIVVKGTAAVTCGEKVYLLHENQSTYIPLGERHRLENPGVIPLELIEVQSGPYLGEDDIVRFEDVYGRTIT